MNRFHRWFCGSEGWARAVRESVLPWVLEGVELGDALLEVGPGPGRVTDVLRHRTRHLTSVEIDRRLAQALEQRHAGTNVTVVHADATSMPFESESFSGALSLTMLHHLPSPMLQDLLLSEVHRVLQPGATFAGCDSLWSVPFHLIHLFDTMVVVEPESFGRRLQVAGFTQVVVESERQAFRFRARRAPADRPEPQRYPSPVSGSNRLLG